MSEEDIYAEIDSMPPMASFSTKVLKEMKETEESFINDINEIINNYGPYFRTNSDFVNLYKCFEIANDILNELSVPLLEELKLDKPTARICKFFSEKIYRFQVLYGDYCTIYSLAELELEDIVMSKHYASIQSIQEKLHHALSLSTYLLKPMQRILKYPLLIKSLMKDSDYTAEELDYINIAFNKVVLISSHINETKRIAEGHTMFKSLNYRILNLKEILTSDNFGIFIMQNDFKSEKIRVTVILLEKYLLVLQKIIDKKYFLDKLFYIKDVVFTEPVNNNSLVMKICSIRDHKNNLIMTADNLNIKCNWIEKLERLVGENIHIGIKEAKRRFMTNEFIGLSEIGNDEVEEDNIYEDLDSALFGKGTSENKQTNILTIKNVTTDETIKQTRKRMELTNTIENINKKSPNQNKQFKKLAFYFKELSIKTKDFDELPKEKSATLKKKQKNQILISRDASLDETNISSNIKNLNKKRQEPFKSLTLQKLPCLKEEDNNYEAIDVKPKVMLFKSKIDLKKPSIFEYRNNIEKNHISVVDTAERISNLINLNSKRSSAIMIPIPESNKLNQEIEKDLKLLKNSDIIDRINFWKQLDKKQTNVFNRSASVSFNNLSTFKGNQRLNK